MSNDTSNLEKYLYQLRRIEEHRDKACEKEIRKIYKKLLKELQTYLGETYVNYSQDDMLTYGDLARVSMDARFLEEVEQRINGISPEVAREIQNTVEQTYEACYTGMVNAVTKAAGNREQLIRAFATVSAVTPDVIRRVVNNPVSGLTLKDTLEKYRKDIIYDIKRNIGIGLSNGDRFTTMAERISRSLDGDYKKAIRIARTEAHRVRESGLCDAATDIHDALKNGQSGYIMVKTWKTMKDERVRPNTVYKTKKGWRKGKKSKYNHENMEGVTIPQDELFELPSGATCMCPGQTGVAGEDINCRCYLSYDLKKADKLTNTSDKESPVRVDQTQKITKKNENNDFSVNRELVNSKEYHDKFANITKHKAANESIYQEAMKMLEHRDGTELEDIVALDARTGKVIVNNTLSTQIGKTGFTRQQYEEFLKHEGEVIILHNHPNSSRLSYTDISTLFKNEKVVGGVAVGHDGSVHSITNLAKNVDVDRLWNETYNDIIDRVKNKRLAEHYTLDVIYDSGVFVYERR